MLSLGFRELVSEFILLTVTALYLYSLWLIRIIYLRRDKIIRFLLAAGIFAASGHFFAITFSTIPVLNQAIEISPIYFTMIGLSFEIFFFNTGLGYKAKFEQTEKIKAQHELIAQLAKNRKTLEQIHEMRNRIAGDLHDDVGSTLSSIGLYSGVASQLIDSDPKAAKDIMQKITDSSDRMMEAMSDIVWAIYSRTDEAGGLATRMQQNAQERLTHTGIRFTFDRDPNADTIDLTIEARRNILLMFKEAVNNAAKYSDANTVECMVSIRNNLLELTIADDGKGFDTSVPGSGNGMLTMSKRIRELGGTFEINTGTGRGTTIKVKIPLDQIIHQ